MTAAAKASARKSLGKYKPLIVYPAGNTEVVEQSPERFTRNTKLGEIKGNKLARGTTYATREEAIAAAQKLIDLRREDAMVRYNQFLSHPAEHIRASAWKVVAEVRLWGGDV
jgi:hypothetical protein